MKCENGDNGIVSYIYILTYVYKYVYLYIPVLTTNKSSSHITGYVVINMSSTPEPSHNNNFAVERICQRLI